MLCVALPLIVMAELPALKVPLLVKLPFKVKALLAVARVTAGPYGKVAINCFGASQGLGSTAAHFQIVV